MVDGTLHGSNLDNHAVDDQDAGNLVVLVVVEDMEQDTLNPLTNIILDFIKHFSR